ncbi:MAG: S-layer homology domain-containing protein [Clostridia bacterium]|nr:S-layer homology domain-containing protein [Clostridia bacterium]
MKKVLSLILGIIILATSVPCFVCAEETESGMFTVVSATNDFEWDYDWKTTIKARYKETKEPITLSLNYDGKIYATVPRDKAHLEIEAYAAQELEFADYQEQFYEFYPMRQLSKTGVIKGNDLGEALPFDNITRAEATAMLLRFLGLSPLAMPGTVRIFEDVTSDKWFYREVLSAYNYGLVKGDSETTFSPERNISREEFAVMASRAVELAGLGYPGDDNMNAIDGDKISDWARDAYSKLGNYVETDVDNTDPENPKRIIDPQKFATRFEAASLLHNIASKCQNYPAGEATLFTDKLNSQISADENYMFSPLSIKMALMMALNGANGETKKEIANALGYEVNIDEGIRAYNEFAKELISRYSKTENLKLNIANSIWINESKTKQLFSTDFKNLATEYYNADVRTVKDANAVKEINLWVSDKTNGKIPQIVNNNDFWAMLINAIYFKGAWLNEFNINATEPDEFNNADGTKAQIDFMNKRGWMNGYANSDLKVVELPYKNRFDIISEEGEYIDSELFDDLDVSMYLMLAEKNINPEETLTELIKTESFGSEYIDLSMPKFKIEYSAKLNDILKSIGINQAFIDGSSDFKKMFDSGNMFISDVLHKTYINVDEKGTEAAAVTSIGMAGSAMPPEPIQLKFNKPFYFVIRDNISGETLFMGRYSYGK